MSYYKNEDWEYAEDLARGESEYFATLNYIFDFCETYELPLTGDVQRMQDGVFIREFGSFFDDLTMCMVRAGWTPPPEFMKGNQDRKEYEQAINTYRKRREFRDSSG